jgi:phage protein D
MSGNLYTTTRVRKPRMKVLANGTEIQCLSTEVHSNNHYQADTFTIEAVLSSGASNSAQFWGNQDTVLIDIQYGLATGTSETASFTSVFQGEIDHLDLHEPTGLIRADGRDLTARLIDAKTHETFLNKTASQVAETLAGRHGLTPVVTATQGLVSRFYKQDHDRITLGQFSKTTTEWDLLTYLAQQEGFDVYVQGVELHFAPTTDRSNSTPFVINYAPPPTSQTQGSASATCDVIDLRLERSLTLAKDLTVIVQSWHSGQAKAIVATAHSTGTQKGGQSGGTQTVLRVFPNLDKTAADQKAKAILEELSRHERVISFEQPGEPNLTARSMVQLQGTGSSWDQLYYVDTITRSMRFDGGFVQHVRAKNHSTDSEAAAP